MCSVQVALRKCSDQVTLHECFSVQFAHSCRICSAYCVCAQKMPLSSLSCGSRFRILLLHLMSCDFPAAHAASVLNSCDFPAAYHVCTYKLRFKPELPQTTFVRNCAATWRKSVVIVLIFKNPDVVKKLQHHLRIHKDKDSLEKSIPSVSVCAGLRVSVPSRRLVLSLRAKKDRAMTALHFLNAALKNTFHTVLFPGNCFAKGF